MRRRFDQLLPLEEDILLDAMGSFKEAGGGTEGAGGWFHAYPLAKRLAEQHGKSLLANGTLYRSLRGMAERGMLERRVETDAEASSHSGPPRRYYRITPMGVTAVKAAEERRYSAARSAPARDLSTRPATQRP